MLDLTKYKLSAEEQAEIKAEVKAEKTQAIQKRLNKKTADEETQAKLDRLEELEKQEKAREFKASIEDASKDLKFKDGQKEKAIKLAGIEEGDDAKTIKAKLANTQKEFGNLLFDTKEVKVGEEVNKLNTQADGDKSKAKIFI